jgi:hypothetical protein
MGTHPISYARHRFPSEVICNAVWLYLRFTLAVFTPTGRPEPSNDPLCD